MQLMLFLLRASKLTVVLSVGAGLVAGASSAALIGLINSALSGGRAHQKTMIIGFAGLGVLVLTANLLSRVLLINLSQKAITKLRMHLSRRMLATPLPRLESMGFHRLLASLTDDVLIISNALTAAPALCINAVTVAVCLVYLGWLAPGLLLGAAAVMLVGISSYQVLVARAVRYLRKAREEQNTLFKHLRALIDGTKELKLHRKRRDVFMEGLLHGTAASLQRNNIKGTSLYAGADSWGQFLFFAFIGLLLFALPVWKQVDPQTLSGYTLTMLYILTPLEVVLSQLPILGRAQVALRQVEALGLSLGGRQEDDESQPSEIMPSPMFERLELVGVTHSYRGEADDGEFTLGPIDMVFERGELVFLAGGNGGGKTTLAKIITGLYQPDEGEILLDGVPVRSESSQYYREHFSVIFSDFYLFESLLGVEQKELDRRAGEYLSQLRLEGKVRVKQGALSTVTALSQGQRKRLALLTAYLEDRPFYVLDEWAADQDPVFKNVFYTRLLPELRARGKTVLVITHDDKYFHIADRVIRLDYGKLASGPNLFDPGAMLGVEQTAAVVS